MNDSQQYVQGTVGPWYERRFWLGVREVKSVRYADGSVGGCAEFYTPWWAWPLELIHRLVFGHPRFEVEGGQ